MSCAAFLLNDYTSSSFDKEDALFGPKCNSAARGQSEKTQQFIQMLHFGSD